MNGALIFEENITQTMNSLSNSVLIDLPLNLSKGIYLIQVNNGSSSSSGKLCIK